MNTFTVKGLSGSTLGYGQFCYLSDFVVNLFDILHCYLEAVLFMSCSSFVIGQAHLKEKVAKLRIKSIQA